MSRKIFDMGRNSHQLDAFVYLLGTIKPIEGVMTYEPKTMREILARQEKEREAEFQRILKGDAPILTMKEEFEGQVTKERARLEQQEQERRIQEALERRQWEQQQFDRQFAKPRLPDPPQRPEPIPRPVDFYKAPPPYDPFRFDEKMRFEDQRRYEEWLLLEEIKRRAMEPPKPKIFVETAPKPEAKPEVPATEPEIAPARRVIDWK